MSSPTNYVFFSMLALRSQLISIFMSIPVRFRHDEVDVCCSMTFMFCGGGCGGEGGHGCFV